MMADFGHSRNAKIATIATICAAKIATIAINCSAQKTAGPKNIAGPQNIATRLFAGLPTAPTPRIIAGATIFDQNYHLGPMMAGFLRARNLLRSN